MLPSKWLVLIRPFMAGFARRVHTQYSCSLPADPLAVLSHHLSEGYAQVFLGRCFALANGEMVVSRSSADLEPIEQLS
jgi:hypothetical protein